MTAEYRQLKKHAESIGWMDRADELKHRGEILFADHTLRMAYDEGWRESAKGRTPAPDADPPKAWSEADSADVAERPSKKPGAGEEWADAGNGAKMAVPDGTKPEEKAEARETLRKMSDDRALVVSDPGDENDHDPGSEETRETLKNVAEAVPEPEPKLGPAPEGDHVHLRIPARWKEADPAQPPHPSLEKWAAGERIRGVLSEVDAIRARLNTEEKVRREQAERQSRDRDSKDRAIYEEIAHVERRAKERGEDAERRLYNLDQQGENHHARIATQAGFSKKHREELDGLRTKVDGQGSVLKEHRTDLNSFEDRIAALERREEVQTQKDAVDAAEKNVGTLFARVGEIDAILRDHGGRLLKMDAAYADAASHGYRLNDVEEAVRGIGALKRFVKAMKRGRKGAKQ